MSSHTGQACMQEPWSCGRKRNGTGTAKMTLGSEDCHKVRNVWVACFLQKQKPSTYRTEKEDREQVLTGVSG